MNRISRNVRVFLLSDVFYYSSYDLINAFLAVLITTKVAEGRLDAVGTVLGYYLLVRALSEIPLAKLLGGLSAKQKINFVSISHIIYGLVIAGMGFSNSLLLIFVFQTILAVIDSSTYPIKWALFSKMLDKGSEELEWSIEDILAALASAIFAVIGGFLSEKYGLSLLYVVMGSTFAVCGIVFHFIKPTRVRHKLDESNNL